MNSFIHMRGVSVDLRNVTILRDVNLTIESGEFWGIAGPNGSGKTTMIRILAGFVLPSQGEVCVLGKPLEDWKLTALRKRVGYLPQRLSFDEGIPISAMEVILMGRTGKRGMLRRLSGKDYEMARSCAAELGIAALLDRPVGSLSGGEHQLVQLARALAQEPKLILLDEPTANLDINHQMETLDLIKELCSQQGLVAVAALHDLNLAAQYCNRLVILSEGRIYAEGSPREVITTENIREVYGAEVCVYPHPLNDLPTTLLMPGDSRRKT